jgi:hypothetical protein
MHVSRNPRGIEVVTTLGETSVERTFVAAGGRVGEARVIETADGYALLAPNGTELAIPTAGALRLPCGLGALSISHAARSTVELARRPIDLGVYAVMAASLAVHLAVLAFAFRAGAPTKPPALTRGASQPRLVANHAMSTRARPASTIVRSTSDVDQPELRPDVVPGPAVPAPPTPRPPTSQMTGARQGEQVGRNASPGTDETRQLATQAARHFDPCADGDCGLIATSRDLPPSKTERTGDDYQLPPRTPRSLETAVVTCDVNTGCNTSSGTDERDVRTEIAHHLGEINACFEGHTDATAAIDARVDDDGTVRVWAHAPSPASECIANVVAKLKFASGERNVTLAFARDD